MAATKQQVLDLERCNINLAALGNIREQLKKSTPIGRRIFYSADGISLRDAFSKK